MAEASLHGPEEDDVSNRISGNQWLGMVAWLCLCVLMACVGWHLYSAVYVQFDFTEGILLSGTPVIEQHASLGPWYQDDSFEEKHPGASGYAKEGYFRDGSATLAFHLVSFIHATPSLSPEGFSPRLVQVDFQPRQSRIALGMMVSVILMFAAGLVVNLLIIRVQRYARQWLNLRTLSHQRKCPVCRYDLRGNVSGVCPECGTPIRASNLPPPSL